MKTTQSRFRLRRWILPFVAAIVCAGAAFVASDLTASVQAATRYGYDSQRRVVSRTTADGRASKYVYDVAGRLTRVTFHRRGALTGWFYPASRTLEARFDPAGRRVAASVDGDVDQWFYDETGRVRRWKAADGAQLSYEYDAWGHVRSIELPPRRTVVQRYDMLGRVVETSVGTSAVRYRYVPDGVTRTSPGGVTSRFESTPDGRLRRIRHERADGRLIADVRYAYEEHGRVSEIDETAESGRSTTQYLYDEAGRLAQFVENGAATTFQYDAMGNRVREDGPNGSMTYSYDALGRLKQAGNVTFLYDPVGTLVGRTDGSSRHVFRYDEEYRLVEVRTPAHVIRYGYDADGNRTFRDVDGNRTRYVTDALGSDALLAVRAADGQWSVELPGSARVRVSADGRAVSGLEGALGSTRWVVDENGAVVSEYTYTAFGMPRAIRGSLQSDASFAGGVWDAEAELLYLHARYYDPRTGRFLSPDPLPPQPSAPHTFNRYIYADNDPVNYFDPEGLQSRPANPPQPPDADKYRARSLDAQEQALEDVAVQFAGDHPGPLGTAALALSALDYAINEMAPWRTLETEARKLMDPQFTDGHPFRSLGAGVRIAWETITPFTEVTTGVKVAFGKGIPLMKRVSVFEATHWAQKRIYLPFGLDPSYPGSKSLRLPYEKFDQIKEVLSGSFDLGKRLSEFPAVKDAVTQGITAAWQFHPMRTLVDSLGGKLPFFPPPGGGGASVPAVGGVYLDQTARIVGNLRAIAGATYDPISGRLVLIGSTTTALRSVFSSRPQDAGMTIDPDPHDPRGPTMVVRFFGGTEQTRLGWTMFEADRVMKGLSLGVDTLSRREIRSSVPDFRSVTAMDLDSAAATTSNVWSRFWLVPEPVTARVSSDGHTVLFDPVKMRVKTETMRWVDGRLVPAGDFRDPQAEAFAEHFTRHYDEISREYPVFAELKQVAGAVALARWMRDQHVPVDWNAIQMLEGDPFTTPSTTPSITRRLTATSSDGEAHRVRTVVAFGGVEMTPRVEAQVDRRANAAGDVIASAVGVAADAPASFTVDVAGTRYEATVLSPPRSRAVGGYDRREIDFVVDDQVAAIPGFSRWYNSLHNERTEFGHSWSLLLPRLRFEPANDGRQLEYVGVAGDPASRVLVQRFRLTNAFGIGEQRFVTHFVDQDLRRIGFQSETARETFRGLYPEQQGYRLVFTNGDQAVFDARGALVALVNGRAQFVYDYDALGQLRGIEVDVNGQRTDLRLEYDERQRIRTALFSGQRVEYRFDEQGNLAAAAGGRVVTEYSYDERRLLHEVRVGGRTIVSNRYDADGRLAEQSDGGVTVEQTVESHGEDTVVTLRAGTETVRKVLDRQQRLVRFESDSYVQQWHFDAEGRVNSTDISSPGGAHSITAFSADRRTIRRIDRTGTETTYRLDTNERLEEVAINGHPIRRYGYDPHGNVVAVRYADGSLDGYSYDDSGRLRAVQRTGSSASDSPETLTLEYDAAGSLVAIAGSTFGRLPVPASLWAIMKAPQIATARFERSSDGRIITARLADGATYSYSYDALRRLTRVQLPDRRCVHYGYDGASQRLASVAEYACE